MKLRECYVNFCSSLTRIRAISLASDIMAKLLSIHSKFQLYRFLARRTDAKFNRIILRRLFMSKINRPPVSIAKIARQMKKSGRDGKIIVVVGTVTNDDRIFDCPKIKVGSSTATNTEAHHQIEPFRNFNDDLNMQTGGLKSYL